MAKLAGHGRAKYTTGTLLGTSCDREWNGLLAERWSHTEGDLGEVRPRDTEVIVMLEGGLRIRRRGDGRLQHHDASSGMVWLVPAGVSEDMVRLYGDIPDSLHMYLPASPLAGTAVEELDIDPDRIGLHYDGGFRDPLIEQIARTVKLEMIRPAPGGKMLIETLASALAVQIVRHHSSLEPASVTLPSVRGALDRRRLKRVRDYIEADLGEDLSIGALAAEACLSPFHFARAFKAATGMPPHRYVTDLRIRRAKALIAEGRLPLAEIAGVCGFSSQAHFTRWFKQIVGMTPGAYRASRGRMAAE